MGQRQSSVVRDKLRHPSKSKSCHDMADEQRAGDPPRASPRPSPRSEPISIDQSRSALSISRSFTAKCSEEAARPSIAVNLLASSNTTTDNADAWSVGRGSPQPVLVSVSDPHQLALITDCVMVCESSPTSQCLIRSAPVPTQSPSALDNSPAEEPMLVRTALHLMPARWDPLALRNSLDRARIESKHGYLMNRRQSSGTSVSSSSTSAGAVELLVGSA